MYMRLSIHTILYYSLTYLSPVPRPALKRSQRILDDLCVTLRLTVVGSARLLAYTETHHYRRTHTLCHVQPLVPVEYWEVTTATV